MVLAQLRQRSTQKQKVQFGISQRKKHKFAAHGPAFAAAARSAVGRVPCAGKKKFTLPRIRRAVKDKFHAFGASFRL